MPGVTVDGNDVEAVDAAFGAAQRRALAGEGPTLIECKTYRWLGHWTGDPQPYRTREEIEDWKQNRDPIRLYAGKLIEQGQFTQAELDEMFSRAEAEAEAAAEYAANSPEPDPAHVLDNVFYEEVEQK